VSVPAAQRLVVVADIHMAAGPREAFFDDARLAALIHTLAGEAASAPPPHLVVLGDLFDFSLVELAGVGGRRLDTSAAAAREKLARIASEHALVFGALRALVAAGARIDLVPGNHDLELLMPPVWHDFRSLVAHGREERPVLRPWIFHMPGVLCAEHGHQHHDVNRVPDLLRLRERGAVPVPAGTALADWTVGRRAGDGAARVTTRLVGRLGAWLSYRQRARTDAAYGEAVAAEATEVGLPADALAAIHALDPDGAPRALARTVRRVASERLSRGPHTPYMEDAALAVHRVLAARGASVPFYLTGHTHVSADVPLADGARYLNPGTWSNMRPAGAGSGYHYVEVIVTDSAPRARLRAWEDG
jgi:UDP-2,3-diacylglucosamine pyrophosphatase LpxH